RPDQLNHRVDVRQSDQQALEDVRPSLRALELVLGAASHDLLLMEDVVADHLAQVERPRYAVRERHHVHAEGLLQGGVLVELVEHDLRDRVALELDHQPHPIAIGLVAKVADLRDLLVVHEADDLLHQPAVATRLDHVRKLSDDDRLFASTNRLDVRPSAHDDTAATCLVSVFDPLATDDKSAGWEIGALDVLHQAGHL